MLDLWTWRPLARFCHSQLQPYNLWTGRRQETIAPNGVRFGTSQVDPILHLRGLKITKGAYLDVVYQQQLLPAVLDTGADCSILSSTLISPSDIQPSSQRVVAVNGSLVETLGQATIELEVGTLLIPTNVHISPVTEFLILGLPWLQSNAVVWDMGQQIIELRETVFLLQTEDHLRKAKRRTTNDSARVGNIEPTAYWRSDNV